LKAFNFILLGVFAAILLYASFGLPARGSADAPIHRDVSPTGGPVAASHYIQNAYPDAATPNIVTVVLADYRGFDTFGEVLVVFSAGMACLLILRRKND